VLEQFSLKNGRRLGALARLPGGLGVQLSDPHPGAGGSVWLTIGTGPRYRSGVAGGDPAPDSCSGRVIAFDPRTRTSSTVTSFGASELIADAIPSPDGRLMVMVGGGCASSYFNEHLIVRDRRTGRQWTLGADAAPCHALFDAAWSADGSQLVFPYGPSRLSPHTHFVPRGTCQEPRLSGLAVVPASHTSPVSSWRLITPDPHCSYMAATFDRRGIAAIEGCTTGEPNGDGNSPNLGNAYVVQLDHHRRKVSRLRLARGFDGGGIASDPRTGIVLVSESQAANNGVRAYNWVWAFNGHRLRTIRRYPYRDATFIVAEPW
jgi:hypothetical protein